MGLLFKAVLAFGIGIGAVTMLQTFWLSSIKQQLATQQAALPRMEPMPMPKIDTRAFRDVLHPKIDPNIGKNAWQGTINRQINQSINAGRLVPTFPRIPRH
jgi:hypothetical protein